LDVDVPKKSHLAFMCQAALFNSSETFEVLKTSKVLGWGIKERIEINYDACLLARCSFIFSLTSLGVLVMELYDKIKFMRMFKGWSQEDMAEKLEMAVSGYAKIEQGKISIFRGFNKLRIFLK
jgi:hypothetical protein